MLVFMMDTIRKDDVSDTSWIIVSDSHSGSNHDHYSPYNYPSSSESGSRW